MNREQPQGLADGRPVNGELIAVMDETIPAVGPGLSYILTTAVIMSPDSLITVLDQFFEDIPNRTRPFHWAKEGPNAQNRMVEALIQHGVVAHCRYQTVSRRGQAKARQVLLTHLADDVHGEGVDHLIIESGDEVTNGRDKASLLAHFKDRGGVPYVYDWRSKQEKLLWVADGVAGVLHDFYAHGQTDQYNRLLSGGVLSGEPLYTS